MTVLNKIVFVLVSTVAILSTLFYGTVHQPVISLFYAAIALMVILWGTDSFLAGTTKFSVSRLQLPLILLAVYAFVQIIPFGSYGEAAGITGIPRTISADPFATQVTAVHVVMLSAFFGLTLYCIDSALRLRRMMTVLMIFGFTYSFYAILQSVLSPNTIFGLYKPRAGTPFGSFVNRHDYAAVIEMLIALPLGMLFTGALKPDKRLIYVVVAGLMGSSLLLSGSRGGLVAMIAEILLLIIITSRSRGRKNLILKAALSFLLVGSAIGGAIFVGGETSLTRFTDPAASEDISSNRTQIWGVTLKVISEHFPFGAGLGAFGQAYTQADSSSGFERVDQAHNDYLQIVADAGLVGLVLGGLFLFFVFREGKRNIGVKNKFRRGVAAGAFAGIFAILIHSLFDFVLHITAISVLFLTLLSLLVASGRDYGDDITDFEDERSLRRRKASVTPLDRRHVK